MLIIIEPESSTLRSEKTLVKKVRELAGGGKQIKGPHIGIVMEVPRSFIDHYITRKDDTYRVDPVLRGVDQITYFPREKGIDEGMPIVALGESWERSYQERLNSPGRHIRLGGAKCICCQDGWKYKH